MKEARPMSRVFCARSKDRNTPIQGLDIDRAFLFSAPPHPSLWLGVLLGLIDLMGRIRPSIPYVLLPSALPAHTGRFYSGRPMTDVSRIADSMMFKVVVPVMQTIISLAAVGAFSYVVSSLSALQAQLASYQTSFALIAQRVDSLERSREATEKFVDGLRSDSQRQGFLIMQNAESLKSLVLNGRPK